MLLSFSNRRMEKEFSDMRLLQKRWGAIQARLIARRLVELQAAENLATLKTLPQVRAHELSGNRAGQISLDVKHPYRLLIMPDYSDPPRKADGGLDWDKVTKMQVLSVEDTHE